MKHGFFRRSDDKIPKTPKPLRQSSGIHSSLARCCQLTLKIPERAKNWVQKTDTSFAAAAAKRKLSYRAEFHAVHNAGASLLLQNIVGQIWFLSPLPMVPLNLGINIRVSLRSRRLQNKKTV